MKTEDKQIFPKIFILGYFLLLLGACSKAPDPGPTPPAPVVVKDFSLTGKTCAIKGMIKPGNSLKVEDVNLHLSTALELLETR